MTDKINKYIADVLSPILDGYVPSMNSQSGDDSGKTVITAFGSALKNTEFYHSVSDAPLIHYTTLDKAKRILAISVNLLLIQNLLTLSRIIH